jgi:PAS domain S-box-containing protein
VASEEAPSHWAERLEDAERLLPETLPDDLSAFDSVWIDAPGLSPLTVARQVARADAAVQTVIVTPPEDQGIHERALLFTPGLGEIWLMGPDEVDADARVRARDVTRKRRRYRSSRERLTRQVEERDGPSRRAVVSDAYLAALLQVLPDPVISVDAEGRVVSWSDAATRCLGVRDQQALGQSVLDVLKPENPDDLAGALDRGRARTARAEIVVGGTPGRLVMEAVVTPVAAGGLSVRTLVLRDVTREREALAQARREVELRSRSYAAMSHEIRTPINAIMGYNELLRMGAVEEGKRDEYLLRSQKAAAHLLALVNDVLDLSKLESGVLELQPEPVRIAEVLQDLVSTVEPMARERNTELDVTCDVDVGEIRTDPRRLKQILINLVSNALKFGEEKPVRVSCERTDRSLFFHVEDRGRGIPATELGRIFEEFVQVGDSDEGTGLGLPISRKLAQLLGGELTADSQPGQGSTFHVRLPVNGADGAGSVEEGPDRADPGGLADRSVA